MLALRLTPLGSTIGGTAARWLYEVGPYGAWSDLQYLTRFGDGACGNYELSWSMPLPAGFEHPLLRRGTAVELMDGPYRIGSPFILSEPTVGAGIEDPWRFTASGIGREVEGDNSWDAEDGSGNTTSIESTAIDTAIANGLRWSGRDSTIATSAFGQNPPDELNSIGQLLTAVGEASTPPLRWGVGQDNLVRHIADPSTPTYQTTPNVAQLGTADDDYATIVKVRYLDVSTSVFRTVFSPASASSVQQRFGRKVFRVDKTDLGAIATSAAQAIADGILAQAKGRLAWVGSLSLTSQELLTMGGVPADLSKVAEDVGNGCIIRLHGIWSDLLEYNGQTYLDVLLGEAKYTDGSQVIDLSPAGLAKRDLAHLAEEWSAA